MPSKELCIVMEICHEGDLQALLWSFEVQNERNVWRFLFTMSNVLKYIHSNDIIHRDIKPQNILGKILPNGNMDIKLADFGIAKQMEVGDYEKEAYTNSLLGTPIYMAPEVWKGNGYGKSSDVWSLGAVVAYLINEDHLFHNVESVIRWPGGISPIFSNKYQYSNELHNLLGMMLNPNESLRPPASLISSIASGYALYDVAISYF